MKARRLIPDTRLEARNIISGETYICKIYLCGMRSLPNTCYCVEHAAPTRTNKQLFEPLSAPVVRKFGDFLYGKGKNRK